MSFYKEATHYEKTALSDLQDAWKILRDTVVENFGFPGSDKVILSCCSKFEEFAVKYWCDFCYPASDDLAIIPIDDTWLTAYFYDQIFELGRRR